MRRSCSFVTSGALLPPSSRDRGRGRGRGGSTALPRSAGLWSAVLAPLCVPRTGALASGRCPAWWELAVRPPAGAPGVISASGRECASLHLKGDGRLRWQPSVGWWRLLGVGLKRPSDYGPTEPSGARASRTYTHHARCAPRASADPTAPGCQRAAPVIFSESTLRCNSVAARLLSPTSRRAWAGARVFWREHALFAIFLDLLEQLELKCKWM
eukprot:gene12564-biopygen4948